MTYRGCGRLRAHASITSRSTFSLPIRLALCALLLSLALPATSRAATYTFTAVADGYTRSDAATASYGTTSRISDRNATAQRRISYLRFNVALLPGDTVTSATLKVYSTTSGSSVDLRNVASDSWTESGLTWNSAPVYGTAAASHVSSFGKYKTVGTNFSCFYSKVDPGLVISDLDMWQNTLNLVYAMAIPIPTAPPKPGAIGDWRPVLEHCRRRTERCLAPRVH